MKELVWLKAILENWESLEEKEEIYQYFDKEEDRQIFWIILQFYLKFGRLPSSINEFILFYENLIEEKLLITSEYQKEIVIRKFSQIFQISHSRLEKDIFLEEYHNFIRKGRIKKKLYELIEKYKENKLSELEGLFKVEKKEEKDIFSIDDFLSLDKPVRDFICPTGFDFLDYYMEGGLALKEIALISSPPGTGKSTFLLNVLGRGLELRSEINFCYISLELSPEIIYLNLLSILFDLDYKILKKCSPRDLISILSTFIEKEKIEIIFENLRKQVIVIYFEPFTPIDIILDKILQLERKNLILFIDYLNEIDEPSQKDLWSKYEIIMTKLDGFANEQNCGIWIATQAHPKSKKQTFFEMKDLYQSKVGISKKISFGLGLIFNIDRQRHQLNFFKNRLKGQIHDTVFLWREGGSLRLREESKFFEMDNIIPSSFSSISIDINENDLKKDLINSI